MQHLAAGLILGAVLWELGPEMNRETHNEKQAVVLGFIGGFLCLMFIGRFEWKLSCSSSIFTDPQMMYEPKGADGLDSITSSLSKDKDEEYEDLERTTKSNISEDSYYSATRTPPKQLKAEHSEDSFSDSMQTTPLFTAFEHGNNTTYLSSGDSPFMSPNNACLSPSRENLCESFEKTHLLEKEEKEDPGKIPIGLIVAVWINGAIDGALIGVAFCGSGTAGLITSIALGIEQGLLGTTTTKSLTKKFSSLKTFIISVLLVMPIPICGLIAGKFLNGLSGAAFALINAFGLSGLLYLVTEELLIEAHEDDETDKWYVSIHTFIGFLIVIVLHEFLN